MISNAAAKAKNVIGPVYVAAFAPDEGEHLSDATSTSKDSVLNAALVALHYPTGQGAQTAVEFAINDRHRAPQRRAPGGRGGTGLARPTGRLFPERVTSRVTRRRPASIAKQQGSKMPPSGG